MITVLGASGFIGSHLVQSLEERGIEFYAPFRNAELDKKDLGNVIYCIGLTGDFRSRPFDTVEAHVCKLKHVLQYSNFQSLTYLSSARIYIHNTNLVSEETPLIIDIKNPFDLYNSSKLTGELLALNCGRKNIKVARLSNVYGNDFSSSNFITTLIKDALQKREIVLRTTPDSHKDYISIEDAVSLLLDISLKGSQAIYNVASGINISNESILNAIAGITGCRVVYNPDSEKIVFPSINIDKVISEFNFSPSSDLISDLGNLIRNFREEAGLNY